MNKKKKITRILYVLIGLIAVVTTYFYFTMPKLEAMLIGIGGVLLILNIVFAVFFIKRNFKG